MDEEDRFSASSQESDRENEADEAMEDVDDGDGDGDDENNEEDEEEDGDNDAGTDHNEMAPSESQNTTSDDKMAEKRTLKSVAPQAGPSSQRWKPTLRPEYLTARLYDIVPTMAAPMSTSINAMAITPDLRYWLTGGSDGYIRKYDGPGTINGRLALTVAQRHPFVDSVTKAGILMSYWENEEPTPPGRGEQEHLLSPVYSLAVHSRALWLLSGLESGAINLQSVRHDEGKRICCLQKHTNAVSVLTLAQDEKSVLSGAWDKNILDWDLNNGQVIRNFGGSGGQISSLELRPASGVPVPTDLDGPPPASKTVSTNNGAPILSGSFFDHAGGGGVGGSGSPRRIDRMASMGGAKDESQASPAHESLFGGSDAGSLFGETAGEQPFGNDDDDYDAAGMEMMAGQGNGIHDSTDMAMDGMDGMDGMESMDGIEVGQDLAPARQAGGEAIMHVNHASVSLTSAAPLPEGDQVPHQALNQVPPPATERAPDAGQAGGDGGAVASSSAGAEHQPGPSIADSQPDDSAQERQPPSTMMLAADGSTEQPAKPSSGSPIVVNSLPPPPLYDATQTSATTFLSSAIDGTIRIWDRRVPNAVARINNRFGVPPWCMSACWSPDGNKIYAGRRNGTVEEFDLTRATRGWEPERVLKFPAGSGAVSAVRPMVNGRHLVCASHDILRLYDLSDQRAFKHSTVPFLIIPGPPRAGVISSLYIDPTNRFMLSAAGTRGWEGTCTEVLIGYEVHVVSDS